MDKKKVLAVGIILLVFVMVIGAFYGVIPTVQREGTSAEQNTTQNKALLQGIPSEITMTNSTQETYDISIIGVKGATTTVMISVMNAPANVSVYFTTTSSSHWEITNNGTTAEYVGYPLYAGDITHDLKLHIKAIGEPSEGTIEYMASSNDILVVESGTETIVNK